MYKDNSQLRIEDFEFPYGELDPENDWVKLASLTEKSRDQHYKFQRLYRNLYNPEFYYLAFKNIYANKGAMTPGVDGTTLDCFSEKRITKIIRVCSATSNRMEYKQFRLEYGRIGAREMAKTAGKACTKGGGGDVQGQQPASN